MPTFSKFNHLPIVVFSIFAFSSVNFAQAAELIYESATTIREGDLGNSANGTTANSDFYSGVRFELSTVVQADRIGGHFSQLLETGNEQIFGGILELDSINEVPDLNDDFLAEGVINLPPRRTSANLSTEVDVVLQPGFYALVFGSGRLGTTGSGFAVQNSQFGPVNQGIDSTFTIRTSDGNLARQTAGARFFLEGVRIPEPSTAVLLLTSCILSTLTRRYV